MELPLLQKGQADKNNKQWIPGGIARRRFVEKQKGTEKYWHRHRQAVWTDHSNENACRSVNDIGAEKPSNTKMGYRLQEHHETYYKPYNLHGTCYMTQGKKTQMLILITMQKHKITARRLRSAQS